MVGKLSGAECTDYVSVVSSYLEDGKDDLVASTLVYALPIVQWPSISELGRMRIENMLLNTVKALEDILQSDKFGNRYRVIITRLAGIVPHLNNPKPLIAALSAKFVFVGAESDTASFLIEALLDDIWPYVSPKSAFVGRLSKMLSKSNTALYSYFTFSEDRVPPEILKELEANIIQFKHLSSEFEDDIPF